MIRTLHPGASARNGGARSLGAVTEALCNQIRCGILKQHEVGLNALWECSQAGFVGAWACSDPRCAPYGGCTRIFERLAAGPQPQLAEMTPEPIIDLPGYTPAEEPTFTAAQPIWYPPETPDVETPAAPPPPSVPIVYEPPPEEIEPEFTPPAPGEPAATSTITITDEETSGRRAVGFPGIDPRNPFYGLLTKLAELKKQLPAWAQGWPWYYWAALILAAYYATRITRRKSRRKRRR